MKKYHAFPLHSPWKKTINPLSLSLQLFNYKKYVKFHKIYHLKGIERIRMCKCNKHFEFATRIRERKGLMLLGLSLNN